MLGTVITFGKKKLSRFTHKLQWPVKPFAVLFDVDKTRVSGVTLTEPRFYAMSRVMNRKFGPLAHIALFFVGTV